MRKTAKGILVTTAAEVQDAELSNYQEALFSTAVIGTGFLSETMASFSDTFGARSSAFEKKIDLARGYVIEDLKEKAQRIGSNCLIGLSFSLNEISSGQKNMFVVSAAATPVTMKPRTKGATNITEKKYVRKEEISSLLQEGISQQKLNAAIKAEKTSVETEVSAFCLELCENGSPQAEKELAQMFISLSSQNKTYDIPILDSTFDVVDGTLLFNQFLEQIWQIRSQLEQMPALLRPSGEISRLFEFLKQYPNYSKMESFLQQDDIVFESIILLPLLNGVKELYTREDLNSLRNIQSHLTTNFWPADPSRLTEHSRVDRDGQILNRSGREKTISAATYLKRKKTVEYLDRLINSLDRLFQI